MNKKLCGDDKIYVENKTVFTTTTSDTKIQKAEKIFYNNFIKNISDIDLKIVKQLSLDLAQFINKYYQKTFPKIVREKAQHLKISKDICNKIYNGEITIKEFVELSSEDMKSEKQKLEEKKIVEDSINSSRQACTEAETTMFKCGRCQKNQCTYYQLQTRSCDEPMTTFVRCTNCGHNWKF
ncbi:transcription elongation factor S-II [Enterocytozoon bieneusi H348]|nr:transcription elongation factor S-II [Enterocytozoon bieneusi H348]|eukprot:XP_001827821.1 transcription elongation factor S-II [Enterocytozoon bieneusi H348]